MKNIGKALIQENVKKADFIEMIKSMRLRPPIVIKPNWGFSICFTEPDILDWTLEACGGDALIVESYGWARSKDMLLKGEWGSFEPSDLRKEDEWFLEYSGIGKILEKHGVEFLNITEENWAGRTIAPEEISSVVEERNSPLVEEDFLGFVPERLFELRGGSFLSLAKVRCLEAPMWVSLSVKNLFGMIPGPSRGKYHGQNHSKLSQSIVDIYKIYDSMYDIKGVVEAIHTSSVRNRETLQWNNIEKTGFASTSDFPVELDAIISGLLGTNPNDVEYLKLASETFGTWDVAAVKMGLELASDFSYLLA